MKKVTLLSLILTFTVFAYSQISDKKWGIGAGLGAYGTLENANLGLMPELYLSKYLSPKLDFMVKSDFGLFNSDLISKVDLGNLFLNLRYKLTNETKNFRPYLYGGPGLLSDNSETGLNFNLGLGSKYYFSPGTALYLDAGYIKGVETIRATKPVTDNFWKATIGLEVDFGKTADSDMDGVSDKKDKCPDTPTGVKVDEFGCPIDTDGDGIADHLDDCPTIVGLTSLKGCPDTDKDGIADKDDACPDVAGVASLKGCPDADSDGVTDKDDKCPNTKKGYKVDASGCPMDRDKDGVIDEEDDCPTVAGPKENKGCPVKEPEKKKEITADQVEIQNIKVTPVHFLSDKSYLTDYSKSILDKLIVTLNSNQEYHTNIYGYADSQGTDSHNYKLSQNRIQSVVKYLISKGISNERIIHQKAFGETKPVASNKTQKGRLQNRRVEFEIFTMK